MDIFLRKMRGNLQNVVKVISQKMYFVLLKFVFWRVIAMSGKRWGLKTFAQKWDTLG